MSARVDTTKCPRRTVSYATLDAIVADAERLAEAHASTTGNWCFARIVDHIATAMDYQVDGFPAEMHLNPILKFVVRTMFRRRIFEQGMQPGFQLKGAGAKALVKEQDVSVDEAIEHLRRSVTKLKAAERCAEHAAFGKMTKAEGELLHRRHAELHMSYVEEPAACSTS